jgi:hypothetical protein
VFKTTSYTACPCSQRKKSKLATTHVAKVDTILSPKPGVTQEGHCQPGTDPTPRTSQTEQKLAMQGYPWGSRRSHLKDGLARLSILILSKTYPFCGILSQITRLMKAWKRFWIHFQLKSKKKSMIYFQILAFKFYWISHSR